MKDAYVKCKICGGKGYYPKIERVGGHSFETPVWCQYCGGKGVILKSKVNRAMRKVVRRNRKAL